MRRAHDAFERARLAVAVVGMGTPAETADFVEALRLPFPVLADPERAAYRAYGLVEADAGAFISPKALVAMGKAIVGGNRGGRPVGDVRQIGGAFVIDRTGTVRWAKPSAYAGDHAAPEELLAGAAEVSAAPPDGSGSGAGRFG